VSGRTPCRYCSPADPVTEDVCQACAPFVSIIWIGHRLRDGDLLSHNGFTESMRSTRASSIECSACGMPIDGEMLTFSTPRHERIFWVHPRCEQVWSGLGNSDQPWPPDTLDPRGPKGK
jgi:hypothetical protein